jgi:hypothetical protein
MATGNFSIQDKEQKTTHNVVVVFVSFGDKEEVVRAAKVKKKKTGTSAAFAKFHSNFSFSKITFFTVHDIFFLVILVDLYVLIK